MKAKMKKHILSNYATNIDSKTDNLYDDPTIITMAVENSDEDEFNLRSVNYDPTFLTAAVENSDEDEFF